MENILYLAYESSDNFCYKTQELFIHVETANQKWNYPAELGKKCELNGAIDDAFTLLWFAVSFLWWQNARTQGYLQEFLRPVACLDLKCCEISSRYVSV